MAGSHDLELLLSEIDLCKADLQLLIPAIDTDWQMACDIENTYHSNRLAGSNLSLQETDLVIRNGLTLPGKSLADNLAALNHYQALQALRREAGEQALISEELLKQLHGKLSRAIFPSQAGSYRNQAATLANGQPAPSPQQIEQAMAEFIHWAHLEGPFLHPVVFAGEILLRLHSIQPFTIGNGRCARLLMNLVLLEEGYPLLNIYTDNTAQLGYQDRLAEAQNSENHDAWLGFVAEQALYSEQSLLQGLSPQ